MQTPQLCGFEVVFKKHGTFFELASFPKGIWTFQILEFSWETVGRLELVYLNRKLIRRIQHGVSLLQRGGADKALNFDAFDRYKKKKFSEVSGCSGVWMLYHGVIWEAVKPWQWVPDSP